METSSGAASDPLVGRLLDERYSLDALLAYGGMAAVFVATDTRLDRTVAVKVMSRHYAADPEFVARFNREAKTAARLSSPHIVAIHDFGTDRDTGLAYLVMELVRGQNLRELLKDRGRLSPGRAVGIVGHMLEALSAAHAAGLVHRDVKPENVLLGDDGRIKVADFGLARAVETSHLTVVTDQVLGTPAYLAPEQFTSGQADARSDVYATGVVLWELLTGTPPHASGASEFVRYQHIHEDVPPPSSAVTGIPPALDALVVRATSRDPSARPLDGGAFLAELQDVAGRLPADGPGVLRPGVRATQVIPLGPATGPAAQQPVSRPTGSAPTVAPPRRRRRRTGLIATAVVLLLAVLALAGTYYLASGRYTHAPGVLGLTRAGATAKLSADGLTTTVGAAVFDETLPSGSVRRQSPVPGARLRKGGTVTLVLSKGPDRRDVPQLAGSTLAAATTVLTGRGLAVGPVTRTFSTQAPAGVVISMSPPASARVRPGTAVELTVSKGVELLAVPDESGRAEGKAVPALQRAGFTVAVTRAFSDTVEKGAVITQSPSNGRAPRGSTVDLRVSKGPDVVQLPNVTGKKLDQARRDLAALGLQASVRALPGGPGLVIGQSPGGGRTLKRGSTVTLYVF